MTWTASHDARLGDLLRYEDEAERFADFIPRVSPALPPPRHLEPLIDVWQRTRTERVLAVIEMPPRHGKTTTAIHGFAWRMMLDPTLHFAYLTYAEALALIKSRQVRLKAQEAGARLTTTAVTHWETQEGGSFLATGVGGGITGKGITGVAVIDDPHKDRREAESRTIRDQIWDWFTDTFWSRLEDDASVLIIQTRWHRDDLVGRVLSGFDDPATGTGIEFERIRLPALAERDDLIGRDEGAALWPSRWPVEKLHGIRSIMGPYGFSSLYQQNPIIKGHQLFGDHPGRFQLANWKLDGHRVVIVCDPAASERTSADHSVALVMAAQGYGPEMKCWIIDHWRGQVEIPTLVRQLRHFQSKYWGVAIAVEAVSGFKAVPQMLAAEDPSLRILPITPLGDKWTRAQPFASAWNEGRVLIPTDVEWAREFMAELTDFSPRASVDDQVDAGAHGFNTLFSAKKPRTRGARRDRTLPFG